MNTRIVGLTAAQVQSARTQFGTNALEKRKNKGMIARFIENLSDPIIRILLIATLLRVLLSFGDCNWFEIGGILLAVFIAAMVTTISEWGSERAFEKMEKEGAGRSVNAMRDGRLMQISQNDVVVGDILHFGAGEIIAADGVLLDGSVSVNQSALNGETIEVQKRPKRGALPNEWSLDDEGCVYRGSVVAEGKGIMRVAKVGKDTFYGAVAGGVQAETRESPLKIRLARLASQISRIGYLMAFLVALSNIFFTLIVDNHFSAAEIISDIKNLPYFFSVLLHAFSLMITVIVVAVPEGLPMMITVVLSSNMRRMQKDGVMVKKMVGIETAGSLNILFTDKTGTLTAGNLAVESFFHRKGRYKSLQALRTDKKMFSALCLSAKYNTDSFVSASGVTGGNQTDRALGEYFKKENIPSVIQIDRLPFDSIRKYATVTLEMNGHRITLIKGAPEIVIGMCGAMYDDGDSIPMAEAELYRLYSEEASMGKRILAFGYKNATDEKYTFLCFVSLRDKLRKGAKDAVATVQNAGVQVVMITGDGEQTASSVAAECGILHKGNTNAVLDGTKMRSLSDQELKTLLPGLRVICRALPEDKMRLVRLSQECGLVVGMTGDGINDAPALKNADVGFSMGSGTDIAKSASDIVLLNDHFSAISKTILYGRTIFRSIRKFVTFQLIMNLAACGVSFLGQFIGIENPITIVQMLWVNMIMDTLGGLAFAGEPPIEYYMRERPKSRTEPILTKDMLMQIFITGSFTLLICALYLRGFLLRDRFDAHPDNIEFLTGFYALFIFIGLFNCIHTRSDRLWIFQGILGNRPFLFILSSIALIQIWIIYYGGVLFRSVPLSVGQLGAVIVLAFSVIPFDFIRRIFFRLKGK